MSRAQPGRAAWAGSRPSPGLPGDSPSAALRRVCSVGKAGGMELLREMSLRELNLLGFRKAAHFMEDTGVRQGGEGSSRWQVATNIKHQGR